jgi:hypothetical protein
MRQHESCKNTRQLAINGELKCESCVRNPPTLIEPSNVQASVQAESVKKPVTTESIVTREIKRIETMFNQARLAVGNMVDTNVLI